MKTGWLPSAEVVHRYVLELRYDYGQIYWDRSGRIIKGLLSDFEGWDFDTIDINKAQISDRAKNIVFNFGHGKLDLSQTQTASVATLDPPGTFGSIAEAMASLVSRILELEYFSRIGFRAWYLYPTASREQAVQMLQNLKAFSIDKEASNSLGEASEVAFRIVVDRATHKLRVGLTPFEQQVELPPSVTIAARTKAREHSTKQDKAIFTQLKAKKIVSSYPHFGVLLDLDASIDDPPYPDGLTISNFVENSIRDFNIVKPLVLSTRES